MGFIGSVPPRRPRTIDDAELDHYGLESEQKDWLRERVGKEQLSTLDVERLSRDSSLNKDEKLLLLRLRSAMLGATRATAGSSAQAAGSASQTSQVGLRSTSSAIVLRGEPERVSKIRDAMPMALIGHEHHIDQFARTAKEFLSEARQTAPVLALYGNVAHGKDQAIVGFKNSFSAEKSPLVHVDFSGKSDRDLSAIFGDGGPLSNEELKKQAKAALAASKQAGCVVRLDGVRQLASTAPALANALQSLLLQPKQGAQAIPLVFVLNFDCDDRANPLQELHSALGAVGPRVVSASAHFSNLSASSMTRYAALWTARVLSSPSLAKCRLEWDSDAESLLGRMLATPHAPLDELDARMQRLIMQQIDTQTTLNRDRESVIRIGVAPWLARDAKEQAARLKQSHAPIVDLLALEDTFVATLGATGEYDDRPREIAIGFLQNFADASLGWRADLVMELSENGDSMRDACISSIMDALENVSRFSKSLSKSIVHRQGLGLEALVKHEEQCSLLALCDLLEGELASIQPADTALVAIAAQLTTAKNDIHAALSVCTGEQAKGGLAP